MIPYNGLSKAERLNSKLVVDALFGAGNASMAAFPLRVVWMEVPRGEVPVSILVSVPKKRFHHAVDRNRVKRMVREAYRQNKHILWDELESRPSVSLALGFVCITNEMVTYQKVERAVVKALTRISEKL